MPEEEKKTTVYTSSDSTDQDLGSVYEVDPQYADAEPAEISKEMDQRLRRKADIHILIFVSLIYGIQFADKLIPSAVSIVGLKSELFSQSKTGYSWVGSSFYLGYLAFEFPMSYALQRAPLVYFTGGIICCWGVLLACSAACNNMESFLACRTLLGALECVTQPALVTLITQWYKRSEIFSRTCLWLAANGLGGIFINSMAYGIAKHSESNFMVYGMSPWRVIYIIMGIITLAMGIVFIFIIPNSPNEAKFLTEEEKKAHLERIRENSQGYGSKKIKPYQILEGLTDLRTWIYGLAYLLSNIPNGGLTVFSSLILQGEGYKGKDALLMNLPANAIQFGGLLATACVSSCFFGKNKIGYTLFGSGLALLCLCLLSWGKDYTTQLAGYYLWWLGGPISTVGLISLVESDSAGYTKKLTSNAVLLVCYCAGNIIGPQTFISSEAPEYSTGKITMACTQIGAFALVCLLLVYNFIENKRRDKAGITQPPPEIENAEFADLTDKEMKWFRYTY